MAEKLRAISENFKTSIKNPLNRKKWQSSIGIAIFVLFVLSSVLVNRSVQALNLAAGNYGYYGGTYGYNSTTSSDAAPSAPTSIASSVTTSSIAFSWTAPTTTTGSTSLNNLTGYCYTYGSTSQSTCTLSDSTTSSASVTFSDLACGTTKYIAVRAYDANNNLSDVLTGSATSSSCGGNGGTGGSSGSGSNGPTYPTDAPTTPVTTPTVITTPTVASNVAGDGAQLAAIMGVARNTVAEASNTTKVSASAIEFKLVMTAEVKTVAANFITYGTSTANVKLGSGERFAVIRDVMETLGTAVTNDSSKLLLAAEQISNGQKPTARNLGKEVGQLSVALRAYERMTGHRPNFKIATEDMAWNTLMYRIRFTRNLTQERVGIIKFRSIYGKTPTTPFDWATVRAWGYQLGVK